MSTPKLDPAEILRSVEEHIESLPVTRRRRRDADRSSETENYGGLPVDAETMHIELTHEQQVDLILLLWIIRDGKAPERNAAFRQLWTLLGLSGDTAAFREANRAYGRAQGGAK